MKQRPTHIKICILKCGEEVNKDFKTLKEALLFLKPVTDKNNIKFVNLIIAVKNPNNFSEIVKVILESADNPSLESDKHKDIRNSDSASTGYHRDVNKRVLFLVNPISGKKYGAKRMAKIEPLLRFMSVNYTVIFTKNQRHVNEIDFKKFSKIIFISGDGLIFDYIQIAVKKKLLNIPVGIIKCGTGNALATAIDALNIDIALLSALYGTPRSMDLTKYLFKGKEFFSFLGFFWGLIADIDLGSEKFRWLGRMRMDIAAIYYLIKGRRYKARLSYLKDGKFVENEIVLTCFFAMSLPFLDEEHFACPDARLNDSKIHLVHSNLSFTKGLGLLLNGKNPKKFREMKWDYITTSEFKLKPITNKSLMDLDGEFMQHCELSASVCNFNIKVMTPEWLDEDTTTGSNKSE